MVLIVSVRRGIASRLMSHVEMSCGRAENSLYVDLFVKETNLKAIDYYKKRES